MICGRVRQIWLGFPLRMVGHDLRLFLGALGFELSPNLVTHHDF
jgi:hypothetical protein